MAREMIKDIHNRVIGFIEDNNGNQIAYDFHNKILGFYEKNSNLTYDFHRKMLGHGNLLMGLIYKG